MERTQSGSAKHGQRDGDYIAQHSTSARIKTLCLVAGMLCVLAFLGLRPSSTPIWMWVAFPTLLIVNCVYAYRVCFTTVRLADENISIRIAPFVQFCESYKDIIAIRPKPGILKLRFADGKSMDLWSGLGDTNEIVSILMKKTDVLPG
jgi:hypothetical protein